MRTRWIVGLLALVLVLPALLVSSGPPAPPGFAVGVNYHGVWDTYSEPARAEVLDAMVEAGTQWVRMDTSWAMFQPTGPDGYDMGWGVPLIDQRIAEVTRRGMKVDLLVYWAPAWASGTTSKAGRPRDPQDFANLAAWIAERYNGATVSHDLKIDALELWNEPDLPGFWQQTPADTAVSDFAELIKAAGPAAKAANPALTVLAGGPSSVDTDWYRAFYATPGVIGSYDGLVVHPYPSPGDAAPEAFDPKSAQYSMASLPALAQLMDEQGDPAGIWATEFGWTSYEAPAGTEPWALGVTQDQQAAYLLRGLAEIARTPRARAAFWYNDWDTQQDDPQQDNFGLLEPDLRRKPSWYAMRCANTGACDYVPAGSPWRFDAGTQPPVGWTDQGFDDGSWQFGSTPVGEGPGALYARTTFAAGDDPSNSASAALRLRAGGAAAVYLNGRQIVRADAPADDGWRSFEVPLSALRPGINQLAVEVHGMDPSQGTTFDLRLAARGR